MIQMKKVTKGIYRHRETENKQNRTDVHLSKDQAERPQHEELSL
jgi:hypothetical protein